MGLARAWRHQIYGASSVALIVPAAMLAALTVLALGGGFSGVGVLGQIFAGPATPAGPGAASAAGSPAVASHALPGIPRAADMAMSRGGAHGGAAPGPVGHRGMRPVGQVGPVASPGPGQTGGAITHAGGVAPVLSAAPRPAPPWTAPTAPGSSKPPPQPGPLSKPTGVDRIVATITPVTEQVPAPVGPAATQAVQAAGTAADGLLAPGAPPPPPSLKVP